MFKLYIVSKSGAFLLNDKYGNKQEAITNADYILLHFPSGVTIEVFGSTGSAVYIATKE